MKINRNEKILVNRVHVAEVVYRDGRTSRYLMLSKCVDTYDGVWDEQSRIAEHYSGWNVGGHVSFSSESLLTREPRRFSAWVDEALFILALSPNAFSGYFFWDGNELRSSHDECEAHDSFGLLLSA
jgi:hypothetical protein